MNPHQKNKVDISSLSADEQRLFRMYGKLPNKKDLLQNKLKERKYFDSGDYALSKAGKASDTGVTSIGTEHPNAENIPHASPLTHTISRSDSIPGSSTSPPSHSPTLTTQTSSINNNLGAPGTGDGSAPTLSGPSPAGMHRGSINGIPGGSMNPPSNPNIQSSRSPVKESYLNRSASIDDQENELDMEEGDNKNSRGISLPPKAEGIPIRR
ncbi:hypothetical protein LTR70_008935 [Exophiala xenobiotica]|uniref:mRNA stability protein n=1 Tax=Lithohypha guttulata TaxID=1690604 RepID=A0ABR0K183_9EURO|nr:hypothetical protein LTR24_008647 [Lithohypha guttulata]KAK5311219.1 hypothetical protein LTR70_008935 [Exophiala xenobiotica]